MVMRPDQTNSELLKYSAIVLNIFSQRLQGATEAISSCLIDPAIESVIESGSVELYGQRDGKQVLAGRRVTQVQIHSLEQN